jgi:calcineurin-like phosphoesterase family protein
VTRPARRLAVLASLWLGVPGCGAGGLASARVAPAPPAPAADIEVTLFLIGDAGAPAAPPDSEPVLAALRAAVAAAPHPVVAFLGDNLYPHGMPDSSASDRPEAERRLKAQLGVLRATGARGIFVPGNHDWDRQGSGGWDAIRRQERFIEAGTGGTGGTGGAVLLPGGGCPGPAVVDLGTVVRLVALDTQWWLHGGPKPEHPASSCPADSGREVKDSLRAALRSAGGRAVVVVGHHPLASGGPHGGHFGWQEHVFPLRAIKSWLWIPLPLIGSAYPIARESGISSQDLPSVAYGRMLAVLDSAFAGIPPLIYAAGHDHALQVIGGTSARYELVSGAGVFGHLNRVTALDSTRFVQRASGFMRIEFLRDGRSRLGVLVVDRAASATEAFALWLE